MVGLCGAPIWAQEKGNIDAPSASKEQLEVNWIYGAYVPKESPLLALNRDQRLKLYVRQTFSSPGTYVKTGLFSIGDQITKSPPEWGDGIGGYAKRVASRHGQFVIQNSFSTLGNGLLHYEPRYDRCRCSGFWPRTRHALWRNFVTYNHTESAIRPQFASYGAALAAGAISSTWKPNTTAWTEAYRSAFTQVGFGMVANWVGEFAAEIGQVIHKQKAGAPRK